MTYDPNPAVNPMEGFTLGDGTPLAPTDSYLVGMGKIQAQLNAIKTTMSTLSNTIDGVTRIGTMALPTIAIGGNQNITITYDRSFVLPAGKVLTDIKLYPIVAGLTAGITADKAPPTEVSRSLTGCVFKVTNNSLVSLSQGNLVVVANLPLT